jgi:hypothetical protein
LKSRESELLLNQIKAYKKWLGEHLLDFLELERQLVLFEEKGLGLLSNEMGGFFPS